MAAKLTWEWGDRPGEVILHKKKGKITYDEVMCFFHEQNMLNMFDGTLVLTMFRVNSERDMYPYSTLICGEPEGDEQTVWIVDDGSSCPICGQEIYLQYCPQCGEKLYGKKGD